MLLPQPDSPTIASVSSRREREGDAVDRLHDAVPQVEISAQAVDHEQRRWLEISAGAGLPVSRSLRTVISVAQPRVEDVAQRVAEQIGAEHG